MTAFCGTAVVVKRSKRLLVEVMETGKVLYSMPDFLRPKLINREPLRALAATFTEKQRADIGDIIAFESKLDV